MAYRVIANNIGSYGVNKYLCETELDLYEDIPMLSEPGSIALVTRTGNTYIKDVNKKWIPLIQNSNSNSGSSSGTCCDDGCFNESNLQPLNAVDIITQCKDEEE